MGRQETRARQESLTHFLYSDGTGAMRSQVRNSISSTNLFGGRHSLTRKYLVPLLFLFIGLACHAVFRIIGAKIAINGMLVESFPLLPIGYLSVCFKHYRWSDYQNSV